MRTAKDFPPDVERYVEEGLDDGMDVGKAWAVAWSRWCGYKAPGDAHCKRKPKDYFPGRKAAFPWNAAGNGAETFEALIRGMVWEGVLGVPPFSRLRSAVLPEALREKTRAMMEEFYAPLPIPTETLRRWMRTKPTLLSPVYATFETMARRDALDPDDLFQDELEREKNCFFSLGNNEGVRESLRRDEFTPTDAANLARRYAYRSARDGVKKALRRRELDEENAADILTLTHTDSVEERLWEALLEHPEWPESADALRWMLGLGVVQKSALLADYLTQTLAGEAPSEGALARAHGVTPARLSQLKTDLFGVVSNALRAETSPELATLENRLFVQSLGRTASAPRVVARWRRRR